MPDLDFSVTLQWAGTGRDGIGEISGADFSTDVSAPATMGGRGNGTNPEELLVGAVASCYTATLFGVLRHTDLPVTSLAVTATGSVSGYPGRASFDRLVVSPTILGADPARQAQYEAAAVLAHTRCMIGNALAREVAYEISGVRVRREETLAPDDTPEAGHRDLEVVARAADERVLAWRSGE